MKCGDLNVVEADDGEVFRHAQAGVSERADRADGRRVVEREQRRELDVPAEQFLAERVAFLVCRLGREYFVFLFAAELQRELRRNLDAQRIGRGEDRARAVLRVGAAGLSAEQRDAAMTELFQMCERELRRAIVIDDDVGEPFHARVAGDHHGRQQGRLVELGGDEDHAVDGAPREQLEIVLQQLRAPVAGQ